jgi:hypothetical protein
MDVEEFDGTFWFETAFCVVSKEESSVGCLKELLDLRAPVCLHSFW